MISAASHIASTEQLAHSIETWKKEGHSKEEITERLLHDLAAAEIEHAQKSSLNTIRYLIKEGALYSELGQSLEEIVNPPLHRRHASYQPMEPHNIQNLLDAQQALVSGAAKEVFVSSLASDYNSEYGVLYRFYREGNNVTCDCITAPRETEKFLQFVQTLCPEETLNVVHHTSGALSVSNCLRQSVTPLTASTLSHAIQHVSGVEYLRLLYPDPSESYQKFRLYIEKSRKEVQKIVQVIEKTHGTLILDQQLAVTRALIQERLNEIKEGVTATALSPSKQLEVALRTLNDLPHVEIKEERKNLSMREATGSVAPSLSSSSLPITEKVIHHTITTPPEKQLEPQRNKKSASSEHQSVDNERHHAPQHPQKQRKDPIRTREPSPEPMQERLRSRKETLHPLPTKPSLPVSIKTSSPFSKTTVKVPLSVPSHSPHLSPADDTRRFRGDRFYRFTIAVAKGIIPSKKSLFSSDRDSFPQQKKIVSKQHVQKTPPLVTASLPKGHRVQQEKKVVPYTALTSRQQKSTVRIHLTPAPLPKREKKGQKLSATIEKRVSTQVSAPKNAILLRSRITRTLVVHNAALQGNVKRGYLRKDVRSLRSINVPQEQRKITTVRLLRSQRALRFNVVDNRSLLPRGNSRVSPPASFSTITQERRSFLAELATHFKKLSRQVRSPLPNRKGSFSQEKNLPEVRKEQTLLSLKCIRYQKLLSLAQAQQGIKNSTLFLERQLTVLIDCTRSLMRLQRLQSTHPYTTRVTGIILRECARLLHQLLLNQLLNDELVSELDWLLAFTHGRRQRTKREMRNLGFTAFQEELLEALRVLSGWKDDEDNKVLSETLNDLSSPDASENGLFQQVASKESHAYYLYPVSTLQEELLP